MRPDLDDRLRRSAPPLEDQRADDNTFVRDDGTEVAVGYGTPYYDANVEYYDAVNLAISSAVGARAVKTGIWQEGGSLSHAGELHCADGWEPSSTWLP